MNDIENMNHISVISGMALGFFDSNLGRKHDILMFIRNDSIYQSLSSIPPQSLLFI